MPYIPGGQSSDPTVQDLLAQRQTEVDNGNGAGAVAVAITASLAALGYE
jgi:hypothetical protein